MEQKLDKLKALYVDTFARDFLCFSLLCHTFLCFISAEKLHKTAPFGLKEAGGSNFF